MAADHFGGEGGRPLLPAPPSPVTVVLAVRQRVLDRRVHELDWGPTGRLPLLVTELPADGDPAQVRRAAPASGRVGGREGVGKRGRG